MTFDHIGLITDEKKEKEICVESTRGNKSKRTSIQCGMAQV